MTELFLIVVQVSPEEGSAESAGLAQDQRQQEAAQEAEDGEARQPRVQHAGVSWPIRGEYCDHTDQSGVSIVTTLTNKR